MGVNVFTDTEVQAFEGIDSKLEKIVTQDGKQIESSFCFLSIGAVPAVNWIGESGLKIDKGVLVDGHLQSSEKDIFSAGNSAQITDPVSKNRSFRLIGSMPAHRVVLPAIIWREVNQLNIPQQPTT